MSDPKPQDHGLDEHGRKPLSHDYPSPGQCPDCHWPQGRMCHCEKET